MTATTRRTSCWGRPRERVGDQRLDRGGHRPRQAGGRRRPGRGRRRHRAHLGAAGRHRRAGDYELPDRGLDRRHVVHGACRPARHHVERPDRDALRAHRPRGQRRAPLPGGGAERRRRVRPRPGFGHRAGRHGPPRCARPADRPDGDAGRAGDAGRLDADRAHLVAARGRRRLGDRVLPDRVFGGRHPARLAGAGGEHREHGPEARRRGASLGDRAPLPGRGGQRPGTGPVVERRGRHHPRHRGAGVPVGERGGDGQVGRDRLRRGARRDGVAPAGGGALCGHGRGRGAVQDRQGGGERHDRDAGPARGLARHPDGPGGDGRLHRPDRRQRRERRGAGRGRQRRGGLHHRRGRRRRGDQRFHAGADAPPARRAACGPRAGARTASR